MIDIAICDDERVEITYLASLVRKWAMARSIDMRLSDYESAESFLYSDENNKTCDILLLDIQMKNMDGVELAHQIRRENEIMQIIFITGYPEFVAEGYARVSTNEEEQQSSYEAQVEYYTKMIQANLEWEFVDVYTDDGISATSTKKRDGFNQMVEDALAGKIDFIITKSVSRFARNTVDSLSTIRKLKDAGVEVWFEKQCDSDPHMSIENSVYSALKSARLALLSIPIPLAELSHGAYHFR